MNTRVQALLAAILGLVCQPRALAGPTVAEPIRNEAVEQKLVTDKLPDGGLSWALGVQNFGVFRASRGAPESADGRGWTYNDHVDLAAWKGWLYVAWTNGGKDQDAWPEREIYSTSTDGAHWSAPAELFPPGVATSLRMHFFRARNGQMLAIAGLRTGNGNLTEETRGGLVVREIRADHSLGPVYTLQSAPNYRPAMQPQPDYTTSTDQGFIAACQQLLANHTFLEQQDYGALLGEQRLGAYTGAPDNFGQAFCFFHRQDGALVGVAKRGWTIVSADNGKTWSAPVQPATIITGDAREWAQRTADGRYSYIFIPQNSVCYPLAVITGDDGVAFNTLRVVHGEVPRLRYAGKNKTPGPQDARGLSEWDNDGSWNGSAEWIAYSVNHEDIWVARIPVPVHPAETLPARDSFDNFAAGPIILGWNTYAPKWCDIEVVPLEGRAKALRLEDHDPYDYARAQRLFPESKMVTAAFRVLPETPNAGTLEIELLPAYGAARPVRLVLGPDKAVTVGGSLTTRYEAGKWLNFEIAADGELRTYTVSLNGQIIAANVPFADAADSLARLNFRTGPWRGVGDGPPPVPETDQPAPSSCFLINNVDIH